MRRIQALILLVLFVTIAGCGGGGGGGGSSQSVDPTSATVVTGYINPASVISDGGTVGNLGAKVYQRGHIGESQYLVGTAIWDGYEFAIPLEHGGTYDLRFTYEVIVTIWGQTYRTPGHTDYTSKSMPAPTANLGSMSL